MSEVIFTERNETFLKVLRKEIEKVFSRGEKVAIKLHMGEPGGKYFLKPDFVKKIADILKGVGCEPFLFDSPVTYNSRRNTVSGYKEVAKENGFTEGFMGCGVVISDDFIIIKEPHFDVQVCKPLADADGVLVLSHFKGHTCSAIGGCIKNLGMGALTKKTKGDIHELGKPNYVGGCVQCGVCKKICPYGCIEYSDGNPHIDLEKCVGCSKCIYNCKAEALKPRAAIFDTLLSEGAHAAWKSFKKGYCVNVVKDLSIRCDCNTSSKNVIVMEDVGFVLGKDIVSVDKAALDAVIKKSGKDIFGELHHKPPVLHVQEAERLGMGKMEYRLKKI